MADSRRKLIRLALGARGESIRQTDGYNTDCGRNVQHGPLDATTDDPQPRLAIVPGDLPDSENKLLDGTDEIKRWPLTVTGRVAVDPKDPFADLVVEDLLADIKRAFFVSADRTLGGLAIDIETAGEPKLDLREAGGTTVGCTVGLVVLFEESYGGS